MPKIVKLSRQVSDMIAAGEVVERPASVVKELVENSIDAGAAAVTVEISRGGVSYIRVTDNGSGIAAEDVETAFLRHATSKIRSAEDLDGVQTLGFRGEALAAISSVSRMEVLTLAQGEDVGTALTLEGGEVTARGDAGCPQGTTMVVRDLFYNTPARMKFLKRDSSEAAQVAGVVQRAALSHPEISFRFIKDGKTELHTPGDNSLRSVVYHIFGRETAAGFLEVASEYEDIKVKGFLTKPAFSRGNRTLQHFFVNGRAIRSKVLTAALEEGYKNAITVGRFPGCVLFLTLSAHRLDVNIHPTKAEVKFQSERQAFDSVFFAVKNALEQESGRVAFQLREPPAAPAEPPAPLPREDFFQQMPAREYRREQSDSPRRDRATGELPPLPVERPQTAHVVRDSAPPGMDFGYGHAAVPPAPAPLPEGQEELPVFQEQKAPYRVVGEILETYILVEQGEKLLIIDKHAAHERVLYEKLKEEAGDIPTQLLLAPQVAALSPEDTEVLLEAQDLLQSLGFQVEDFGDALMVRGVPADLQGVSPEELLGAVAEKLRSGSRQARMELRDALLYQMSCKAAIKGGMVSSTEELRRLVDRVMQAGDIKHCPHGRPVVVEITRQQLERQFKRT